MNENDRHKTSLCLEASGEKIVPKFNLTEYLKIFQKLWVRNGEKSPQISPFLPS